MRLTSAAVEARLRPNNGHSYGGGPSSSSHAGPPSDEATFAASDNLTFDGSSFESANLASARLVNVNPNEYDLAIRSDTLNERHKVWFYFSVRGARAGQKAILNLVGYSKTKSLFREGMAPVVCSTGRPYWERMPANSDELLELRAKLVAKIIQGASMALTLKLLLLQREQRCIHVSYILFTLGAERGYLPCAA